jgi:hypothetical protein
MPRFWRRAAGVLMLAFALAGCERGPGTLSPVRGVVSYRGSPLRGGTVVFTPDALRGASGPAAYAAIQPDGSYVLRTGDAPGAVPGWHRITVAAVEAPAAPRPGERFVVPRSLLPDKFRDPELSGLCREVKPDQDNQVDLHLE